MVERTAIFNDYKDVKGQKKLFKEKTQNVLDNIEDYTDVLVIGRSSKQHKKIIYSMGNLMVLGMMAADTSEKLADAAKDNIPDDIKPMIITDFLMKMSEEATNEE